MHFCILLLRYFLYVNFTLLFNLNGCFPFLFLGKDMGLTTMTSNFRLVWFFFYFTSYYLFWELQSIQIIVSNFQLSNYRVFTNQKQNKFLKSFIFSWNRCFEKHNLDSEIAQIFKSIIAFKTRVRNT